MNVPVLLLMLLMSLLPSSQQRSNPQVTEIRGGKPIEERNDKVQNESKTIVCIGCSVNQQPQNPKQAQDEEKSEKRLYHAYIWFTIIGVCGGFIGLCLIWKEVKATERAANAAQLNAQAVIDAERAWFCLSENPFNKPYLVPYDAYVTVEERKNIRASYCFVVFKNYGDTPAKLVGTKFKLAIGTGLVPPDMEAFFSCADDQCCDVVPPDAERLYEAKLLPEGSISSAQLGELEHGNTILWICGAVKYEDVFNTGIQHETRFCYLRETRTNSPEPFWVGVGPKYNTAT